MLCYDVTSERSFDSIANWIRNIEENASEDVEKLIIGNKADLDEKRVISTERGKTLALQHNIPFFETSAQNGQNVEEAFISIARTIKNKLEQKIDEENLRKQQQKSTKIKLTADMERNRLGGNCC